MVNHFYIYTLGADFGPFFKESAGAPSRNGHLSRYAKNVWPEHRSAGRMTQVNLANELMTVRRSSAGRVPAIGASRP